MDISDIEKKLGIEGMSAEEQMAMVVALQKSAQEKTQKARDETIGKSAELVIQGLKKIKSDIESRFSELNDAFQAKVESLQDGKDGRDGKDGKNGRDGKQGVQGSHGKDGRDGRDGMDGADGISVTSARIDFDGSLIIGLSSGRELNVGEVVTPDLAERIKVITNGGGTSQSVLDTLDSLQTQINNLIPSQTGNSGKFLTTNGTTLSWASASASGGLSYQGTWNASTNTPTLTSSVGTNGYYYVVSVTGSTNLNGITDWVAGDWAMYNGSVWQKIDQTNLVSSVNGQTGAVALTYTDVNAIGSITSTDGSVAVSTASGVADLSVSVAASTTNVICQVRNTTGATLTKGTAVYISGATGQIPTVTKAQANSDVASAQTLGLMSADLANNSNGYVTIIGLITEIDTSAYTDGAQLYLSGTTAGALTATKTYAPTHLVYVAVVEYAHAIHGKLFVKVQNGYELDEIHNVSAQSPSNGQTIIYNATTSLWEKANLTAGTGISVTNGAGSITVANTGVTSVSGTTGRITSSGGTTPAIDLASGIVTAGTTGSSTLIPVITVDTYGRVTSITTASNPQGTVTSVTGTSPVASSGGATPAISLSSGYGDTQNPYASKTANYVLAAPNGTAGAPTFRALVASDVPTLNQNTTGSAATLTTGRTISISGDMTYTSPSFDGSANVTAAGTLATVNANVGSFTNASITVNGKGLITAASSGTAPVTSVTGTSPVVSSGGTTPAISLASGYGDTQNPYASKTANYFLSAPNGTAGAPTFRAIVAADIPTLNQNTTGTASNVTGTVAIANGGSGQTTAQGAMNAFAGAVTSGSYLRGNGTNVVMSTIQAGDIPTLNQNTTGTASNVTGTVVVANGGTGLTSTPTNGQIDIGNGSGFTRTTLTAGSNITITNGAGSITIASSGGSSSGPTFSAYASSSQTISLATNTKVTLDTENFDTDNNFASSRFTPTVAGYYQINAKIRGTSTSSGMSLLLVAIYKNGSSYTSTQFNTNAPVYNQECGMSTIVYCNGTTDYIELYGAIYGTGTPSFNYAVPDITSAMSGFWVRS